MKGGQAIEREWFARMAPKVCVDMACRFLLGFVERQLNDVVVLADGSAVHSLEFEDEPKDESSMLRAGVWGDDADERSHRWRGASYLGGQIATGCVPTSRVRSPSWRFGGEG